MQLNLTHPIKLAFCDLDGTLLDEHSAMAPATRQAIAERFPNIQGGIRICDIGTIIASHTGRGTVAVFFVGDERSH